MQTIREEGIEIQTFGEKISKELDVFYNPEMKLNRDISLIVLDAAFNEPILYCDPMAASGIRELRFLKTIPQKFKLIRAGDISKQALETMKNHFQNNAISTEKIEFIHENAINTLSYSYYHMIEIDPFGTPVPFLDTALQRIKHNGILSITATDTAALCGTYPKTAFRRYSAITQPTFWYDEFGLRTLIAYCQKEAAKYDKVLDVLISFSAKHFYRAFFRVRESKTEAYQSIKNHKYIKWNRKEQTIHLTKYEEENSFGKIYTGKLKDQEFLEKLNLELIEDKKEAEKLITSLKEEIDVVGYYNPHKFEKFHSFSFPHKFDDLLNKLKEKEFQASRVHNNKLGIKTNASGEEVIKIMKEFLS